MFLLWKLIKYIFVLFVLKRCLELGVLLWNQLELLYSLCKEIGMWPPSCKFFIIHPRNKNLNPNDAEFDLSMGHALVLFLFFWIIKNNVRWNMYIPPKTHIYWYVLDIKHFHQILWSLSRVPLETSQLHEITLFSLLSDVIPLYESAES